MQLPALLTEEAQGCENRNMVSENRSEDSLHMKEELSQGQSTGTYGSCVTPKTVKWKGDWTLFKKLFRAASASDGVKEAIEVGERVAKGLQWPLLVIQGPQGRLEMQESPMQSADMDVYERAAMQSAKLADLLILTLGETVGIQQSLVMEEAEDEGDGVAMWAKLVSHHERRTVQLNIVKLMNKWENKTLGMGEHPDQL